MGMPRMSWVAIKHCDFDFWNRYQKLKNVEEIYLDCIRKTCFCILRSMRSSMVGKSTPKIGTQDSQKKPFDERRETGLEATNDLISEHVKKLAHDNNCDPQLWITNPEEFCKQVIDLYIKELAEKMDVDLRLFVTDENRFYRALEYKIRIALSNQYNDRK